MAKALPDILNVDLSYPGISFGYETWAMESCLKALEDRLPIIQEQYRQQATAELETRRRVLEDSQMTLEEAMIDEAAATHIPQFLRNGAIVQIWGLFESFVYDIARYAEQKLGVGIPLRDLRADTFVGQAQKYFDHILNISLPWSSDEITKLLHLLELRNVVAHRGGRLLDLSAERQRAIARIASSVAGASIEEHRLVVSAVTLKDSADLVFRTVGALNQLVHDRCTKV